MDNVSGINDKLSERDYEFINLCNRYNPIKDYAMRLRAFYKETGKFPPHDGLNHTEIFDGVEYTLHLSPWGEREVSTYSRVFLELFEHKKVQETIDEFNSRLEKCRNSIEKEELLKTELEAIATQIKTAKDHENGTSRGWQDSKRKVGPNLNLDSVGVLRPREIFQYIRGICLYHLEIYVIGLLRAATNKITEYPPSAIHDIEIPNLTPPEVYIQYLEDNHKYDTLRRHTVNIEGYGAIPVYKLFHYDLRQRFVASEIPLVEYAKGYTEGLKTEFIPFFDTPENRRELIIDTIGNCTWGFPESSMYDENGNEIIFLNPESFYEYGVEIGKQKKAWDIVLSNKSTFRDFLNKRWSNITVKPEEKQNIVAEARDTDVSIYIKKTIDEYLECCKENMLHERDYKRIVKALASFFCDKPDLVEKPFTVRPRSKVKLSIQLGFIHEGLRSKVSSYEYLIFCRGLFACYKDEQIEQRAIVKSRMYKYFTR